MVAIANCEPTLSTPGTRERIDADGEITHGSGSPVVVHGPRERSWFAGARLAIARPTRWEAQGDGDHTQAASEFSSVVFGSNNRTGFKLEPTIESECQILATIGTTSADWTEPARISHAGVGHSSQGQNCSHSPVTAHQRVQCGCLRGVRADDQLRDTPAHRSPHELPAQGSLITSRRISVMSSIA